ncbi:MAG: NYN domain-containing protein, partial [Bacteroidia bacterium]|nr:NYN domain-containing protein [Bacteroidia bacterium]
MIENSKIVRIAVFYDGGYFSKVSEYYRYTLKRGRLNIEGIHKFISEQVASFEKTDVRYCHVVDSHYFRGRFSAYETKTKGDEINKDLLFGERSFEDVLMRAGVVTHFLPMTKKGEKGIDVWLALEAFELAVYKKFNVVVLITGDSDYLPLIRKLNALGTSVMLLGWDFPEENPPIITSEVLINEVTYYVNMRSLIDDKSNRNNSLINGLFVDEMNSKERMKPTFPPKPYQTPLSNGLPNSVQPIANSVQPTTPQPILNTGYYQPISNEVKTGRITSNNKVNGFIL